MLRWIVTAAAMLLTGPGWAVQQSVVLSVPGMTCPTCPITVKVALTRIDGVIDVKSNLPKRETTVVFDSAKVKVETLTGATKNAGFPSALVSVHP